ncbi:hypothetical protein SAZ11_56625 [Streptomyces sp. FXJ1.4098]|nr:hypothetical protein [Streptomyces sp. FXJ1.4098]
MPAGTALTLTLIQALIAREDIAPRLWLATHEAVATSSADTLDHPLQAMVWGWDAPPPLNTPICGADSSTFRTRSPNGSSAASSPR